MLENQTRDGFRDALLSVDRVAVKEFITRNSDVLRNYQTAEKIIVPVLEEIGAKWEKGEVSLAQVYMSGRLCQEMVEELLPETTRVFKHQPKTAIVAFEDFHLLGKRIVYSILKASGYEVKDYGHKNSIELLEAISKDEIEVLLISTLMLHSALRLKDFIITAKSFNPKLKIIVGGAPFRFDTNLYLEINADAMCTYASEIFQVLNTVGGVKE